MSELWSTTFRRNRDSAPAKKAGEKFVLFVCVENANRSRMAERFARHFGAGKIKSFSAGSRPASKIGGGSVAVMKELGFEMEGRPRSFDEVPDVQYDLVVTMGCGDSCPHVRSKRTENWEIPDPGGKDEKALREVRDLIRDKVQKAVERLLSPERRGIR